MLEAYNRGESLEAAELWQKYKRECDAQEEAERLAQEEGLIRRMRRNLTRKNLPRRNHLSRNQITNSEYGLVELPQTWRSLPRWRT